MNDTDNKPKFIKFSDGRHGQELEVLADELASQMPKDVRGKLAPSVLWIARHFKTQNDDLRVNLEKVKQLEEENAMGKTNARDLTQARDEALQELAQLREQLRAQSAQPSPRTGEESLHLIREGKCPVCGGELRETKHYTTNEPIVNCKDCFFWIRGTLQEPRLMRRN